MILRKRFGSGRITKKGVLYELAYSGDLEMDQQHGPLSGRIAGQYENVMIHLFGISLIHRF